MERMGKWKRVYSKKPVFYELVLSCFLTTCMEVFFRALWMPTPLSFLFPAYIFAMYLSITQRPVSIKERWWLFSPFSLFMLFLGFLFFFTRFSETVQIWTRCFQAMYMIVTFICMLPVIVGMQRCLYAGYDGQKFFFIQFLSFLQLFDALLLMLAYEPVDTFTSRWAILLLPTVAVLMSFPYLIYPKRSDEMEFLMMIRMKHHKRAILFFFNERKIFLNPDLTLNMLSVESKIDKPDLEFFFNKYIGKSFPHFVAEYRVANAVKMIVEEGNRYTLEAIGYASGFRCRASFNKYFKLITGMLPSHYLNMKKTE